ncbi:MAG TPA: 50S ribosomal protein L29 [Longimicrobiales bacterium]|nr:50S ribosomal protein L29 [Longimicrobiales bacterium]
MKAEEIRDLDDDEIAGLIEEKREALFRLRFRSASQSIERPSDFRALRRDVARLKTVLRERETANG